MIMIRRNASRMSAAHGQPAGMREVASPAAAGEPGGHVQHPEAQQFRLSLGEVAVEREHLEPGDEVGGDRGELHPYLVDGVLAGGEPAQPGFLGGPDAVLDPGVGAVPGLQEGELSDAGVGGEGLVAVAVGGLEQ
jgi:hypothetical protein